MTSHQRWTRRLASAGTGTAALLLAGGIAYAAWSAVGAGSGAAASGAPQALGVSATVGSTLYPGGSANLQLTVTNPNASSVTVTSFTLTGAVTASGCTTPGVTVSLPPTSFLPIAPGGTVSVTLTNAVSMTSASSSDCQGATFTIPLQATGRMP